MTIPVVGFAPGEEFLAVTVDYAPNTISLQLLHGLSVMIQPFYFTYFILIIKPAG
jgi:hypothetical protein